MAIKLTVRRCPDNRRLIPRRRQLLLKIHDLLDLRQEPSVDPGQAKNLLDGEPRPEGVPDVEDAFGIGHAQLLADDFARENVAVAIDLRADAPWFAVAAQAAAANFQRTQTFL